jgi:hypothetical protein
MRQRITFIHRGDGAFDENSVTVGKNHLTVNRLIAAREDRLTIALHKLPVEVKRALGQTYELHIKWVSPNPYKSVPPFSARLPPGLHVFLKATAPKEKSYVIQLYGINSPFAKYSSMLCNVLRSVFGGNESCVTVKVRISNLSCSKYAQLTQSRSLSRNFLIL